MIHQLLTHFFKFRKNEVPPSFAAQTLTRLMPVCLICSRNLSQHCFALIATDILDEQTIAQIFREVRLRNWTALSTHNRWDATKDNVVVYLIRGSHAGAMVAVCTDPFELYAQARLLLMEPLEQQRLAAAQATFNNAKWNFL